MNSPHPESALFHTAIKKKRLPRLILPIYYNTDAELKVYSFKQPSNIQEIDNYLETFKHVLKTGHGVGGAGAGGGPEV